MRSVEKYPVDADDDKDHLMCRPVWTIAKCLFHSKCSKDSWKKHRPWSLESPMNCLSYLKYHLVNSGKHEMSEEAANEAIAEAWSSQSIEWDNYLDKWQDREMGRKGLEGIQKKKQATAGPSSSRPPKRQRTAEDASIASSSNDPAPPNEVVTIQQLSGGQVTDLECALRTRMNVALLHTLENHGITTCTDSLQVQLHYLKNLGAQSGSARDNVTIPRANLRAAGKCIDQAEECMKKAFCSMMTLGQDNLHPPLLPLPIKKTFGSSSYFETNGVFIAVGCLYYYFVVCLCLYFYYISEF